MKKEYNIVGLDCGHCALTLEKYLAKVDGVKECNINFTTSKLFIDIEDDKYKDTIKKIFKVAHEVNPDVKITEEKREEDSLKISDIIIYSIGLIIGLFVLFMPMPKVLFYILLVASALLMGYKTYLKAILQLKTFKINENTLITISIIGACALGESMEGLMVIALYTLGKMLESRAVNYSRKSISSLISSQPEYAVLFNDEVEKKVKPEEVKIGDKVIVKPGEKVPLDGIIIKGSASVDKKHLTGESTPIVINVGDTLESGCIVLDSAVVLEITAEYKDSTVSRILNLVSSAQNKKSKTETFISKFSSYYTLGVIIASIVVWGITWAIMGDINTAIYRGLIFLVVSCPCAFAISVPLSYFSGIGRCSKSGILIKGSNYLDTCAKLDSVYFDKTGTLTTGNFEIVKIDILVKMKEDELMDIVVAGESKSLHLIAKAICDYYSPKHKLSVSDYKEIAGKGIEFDIKSDKYFIGRNENNNGYTEISVIRNNETIGIIYLQDKIKDNAKDAILDLKEQGVKTMMLTGDNNSVATRVSGELGIDDFRSQLLPKDKFDILKDSKSKGNKIAFVGDGINDAPALALSDVGISMGIMGSDATIESSDVVIADDNLDKISELLSISKYTRKIVFENIIFAGVTKLTFLTLGALGITGMLLAVFADVGVTLIAILNSLRVLSFKNKKKK